MKAMGETGPPNKWVQFTKRTNDPKLGWLEAKLKEKGIESRRHGESWHAPILQVRLKDLEAAWAILDPFDNIRDDAPTFAEWYREASTRNAARWQDG